MEKAPLTKAQRAIHQERRLAKVKSVIADWRASGMSAQEHGDSVGIPTTTLHFWSQELRKKEADAATNVMNGDHRGFLPLIAAREKPQAIVQEALSVELFLHGGRRVAICVQCG